MPRINPVKCTELLYHILALNKEAWDISKNPDLTKILENQKEMIELFLKSIENTFSKKKIEGSD